jgi:hypothetical protein
MEPPSYNDVIGQQPSPSAPPPQQMGYGPYRPHQPYGPQNHYPHPYPGNATKLNSPSSPSYYPHSPERSTLVPDVPLPEPPHEEVKFGWKRTRAYCPNCRQYVRTDLEGGVNDNCKWTVIICCFLGLLACGSCMLGVLPAICMATKKHLCPICKLKIGEHVPQCCCGGQT